jgi:hypothetical protein
VKKNPFGQLDPALPKERNTIVFWWLFVGGIKHKSLLVVDGTRPNIQNNFWAIYNFIFLLWELSGKRPKSRKLAST